jgi:outer membrane murein-binding lipoprotein Lpp
MTPYVTVLCACDQIMTLFEKKAEKSDVDRCRADIHKAKSDAEQARHTMQWMTMGHHCR